MGEEWRVTYWDIKCRAMRKKFKKHGERFDLLNLTWEWKTGKKGDNDTVTGMGGDLDEEWFSLGQERKPRRTGGGKDVCENEKERERNVCHKETKIFSTREFHSLAVDDEVGQLLGDLSTLLLVLREVELLAQLHVKHLQVQVETWQGKPGFTWRDSHVLLQRNITLLNLSARLLSKCHTFISSFSLNWLLIFFLTYFRTSLMQTANIPTGTE